MEEGCPSGDFIYDIATKTRLVAVDRWNGVTAGADLALRVSDVHRLRRVFLWASLYFPASLLAISVPLLALGLRARREQPAT